MSKLKDPLAPQADPSPSRSDSIEIVEAIVAAALAIGDPGASVNLIAERAGVGVASLYRYFPTKAAIYAEISRRLQRDFVVQIREVLARPGLTVEGAVEACCRLVVIVPGVSPALRRALNLMLPASWSQDNANTVFVTVIDMMTRWLEAHVGAPPPELAGRVFAAIAAARGMVMLSRIMPEVAPPDEELVTMMVRGTLAYLELTDQVDAPTP